MLRKTAVKRKPTTSVPASTVGILKKIKTEQVTDEQPYLAGGAHERGVVLRKYYPPEMTNARARAYSTGLIRRPIEELYTSLLDTAAARKAVQVKDAVVHWFKMDLRQTDNTALALASAKAKETGVPLICMYLISPEDYEAHLRAPVRIDFMLRTLAVLKQDLHKLDIPLYVETVERRKDVPDRVLTLLNNWGANHLYANMEYEVDELRREARLVRLLADNAKSFEVVHDTCVVPPGKLQTGTGKQYAVYSPWYRSWVAYLHANLDVLELFPPPCRNPELARDRYKYLFDYPIPEAPANKALNDEEKARYRSLWACGEHEAIKRLNQFCQERIGGYAGARNFPAKNGTSCLSVHLASGTISARTCIRTARDRNVTKKLDGGTDGIATWMKEVAWRDFYKHVLVNWPHICMNKPFKPEFSNVPWSSNEDHFTAWCEGKTGFPIVDAAMRQLHHMGYMHNRCRMIVASFLSKDLLIDWRKGERYFMEHLVDGDFASNNGGWGFSSSVGVDPQPYFRIFNPLLQSEKFDPDGNYIREWVPELANIAGKAVHDPYHRGAAAKAEKMGYPRPIVEHKGCRERALNAYKQGIASEK
ncbi:hypothetical protein HDU85_003097 [Gaertneriomyces sp. JEL0708]|nr:hypothetical protein HDU85_003097 [Gaertneriomyces sp. JEL0708]